MAMYGGLYAHLRDVTLPVVSGTCQAGYHLRRGCGARYGRAVGPTSTPA